MSVGLSGARKRGEDGRWGRAGVGRAVVGRLGWRGAERESLGKENASVRKKLRVIPDR